MNNTTRKFMRCLTLLVGWFFAYFLWISMGWSESETWNEWTVKYIVIIILIPLFLWISISLMRGDISGTQSLGLSEKKSSENIDNET